MAYAHLREVIKEKQTLYVRSGLPFTSSHGTSIRDFESTRGRRDRAPFLSGLTCFNLHPDSRFGKSIGNIDFDTSLSKTGG